MFKSVTLWTTILTWFLIGFGAFVRLEGAGISCPDWPLCYGQIIPPEGYQIALEVGHRFVASVLGLLILFLLFLSYRDENYRAYRGVCITMTVVVIVQGILGGATVLMQLWPPTVILHLLGGNLLLMLLTGLCATLYLKSPRSNVWNWAYVKQHSLAKITGSMLLVFLVVLLSGGVNSSTYSGYACEAFPGCHAESFLSFDATGLEVNGMPLPEVPEELKGRFLPHFPHEWFHMMHRLIAVAGVLYLLHFCWHSLRKRRQTLFPMLGSLITVLCLAEVALGVTNAVFRIPVPISALHTLFAASLAVVLTFTFTRALHEPH